MFRLVPALTPRKNLMFKSVRSFTNRKMADEYFNIHMINQNAFFAGRDRAKYALLLNFLQAIEGLPNVAQRDNYFNYMREENVIAGIKVKLTDLVVNSFDFKCVAQCLSSKKQSTFIEDVKRDKPPGFIDIDVSSIKPFNEAIEIKDGMDFKCIMESLPTDELKETFFNSVQHLLPSLTTDETSYHHIMKVLLPKLRKVYFDDIKSKLPELIQHNWQYARGMEQLAIEEQQIFSAIISKELQSEEVNHSTPTTRRHP